MFSTHASELLRDLKRTESNQLPAYNGELIQQVIKETHEHNDHIYKILVSVREQGLEWRQAGLEDAASVLIHHQSIVRNKRCLMGYLHERMSRIKALRWQLGALLPPQLAEVLSPSERDFFKQYSDSLGKYMTAIGLDLAVDMEPPKDPVIFVRVLEDRGSIYADERVIRLERNLVHSLRREDAEQLIKQGVLEHCDEF